MSNLSDDTLRKILVQIQNQAISAQKQLSLVRAQIASKEKEKKILTLTVRELGTVPEAKENKMYKGVGKMFIEQPREEINREHSTLDKSLTEEISNLTKKAKYLEKQFDEANGQLKDIFHSQQRQEAAA
ncbi:hypothetical protein CI109_104912 [Kwoniella shandongensis]|uniref:Uncharacterized protein n=1 Tax=Kwoniella shandongensis TaxID=1734106 RepID=A0A5M6BVR8_9TREE|nr:uncharacterized protein CI109_006630 [Kwoniella shandongensis]KAA5525079.1 hypothetical protein CI109_006630 [Kwoniella shandongensis]